VLAGIAIVLCAMVLDGIIQGGTTIPDQGAPNR